jgi:hypothetical protein
MRARPMTGRTWTWTVLAVLLTGGASACSKSATAPAESAPQVVVLPADAHGAIDEQQYYPGCLVDPNDPPKPSTTCPVLRWDGTDFWAMAYGDNRSSMAIHVFGEGGVLRTVVERPGARYLYAIVVDSAAETVTFHGQGDRTVTMTWDELRALR